MFLKMCIWFWYFENIFSDRVTAFLDLEFPYKKLCLQLLDAISYSLETLHVLKCAYAFGI